MLKSSLCDYSDTYKLVEGTIIITGAGANAVERKQMKEKNVKHLKLVLHLLNKKVKKTIQK